MNSKLIHILLLALCVTACKTTEYEFPAGDLKGKILPPGVKVTFDQGDKQFSAVSDAQGNYIIPNLEMGSYNIVWEKPGYFTFKKFGYQFLGGPTTEDITNYWIGELSPVPHATIDIKSMENVDGLLKIGVLYHYSESDSLLNAYFLPIRWFVSDKPNVSPTDYLNTFLSYSFESVQYNNPDNVLDVFYYIIAYPTEYYSKLSNITTLYFIAYPSVVYGYGGYFDWARKEMVYPIGAVGSKVDGITIPATSIQTDY